jgi:hypothetical protein
MSGNPALLRSAGRVDLRGALHAALAGRQGEIEAAVSARIEFLPDLAPTGEPNYLHGLRAAVHAGIGYSLRAIESGVDRIPPVPAALLAQARLAAHHGIGIDTVLRRYIAGYTVLTDFIVGAASEQALPLSELHRIEREQALLLDRVLADLSEEHSRESAARPPGSAQRHAERIRRLLRGEPVDTSDLCYEFGGHHVALVASGPAPIETLRQLAGRFDCLTLFVDNGEAPAWAWFGTSDPLDGVEIAGLAELSLPDHTALAIGEAGQGPKAWALSHRQAAAALPVAQRARRSVVRYSEVAVLASILQDDLAADSLRRQYLDPLWAQSDRGETLCQTLRAYFTAERNVSSAAAAIGVSRRTVANRLRVVEGKLGASLGAIGPQVELALRLDELQSLR